MDVYTHRQINVNLVCSPTLYLSDVLFRAKLKFHVAWAPVYEVTITVAKGIGFFVYDQG